MNINELGEDLEQQFGKPRNITEENVRFMISLIKEEFDGTKVNENIETPSLEAFGMTILAVIVYILCVLDKHVAFLVGYFVLAYGAHGCYNKHHQL